MKYKIISIFVLLFVFFVSVPAAKAYTVDDLMTQIASLQQQVSSLQSAIALRAIAPTIAPVPTTVPVPKVVTPTISTGCQTLYWTDNNNKTCASAKQFCGAYLYQGLSTFATQAECLESLHRYSYTKNTRASANTCQSKPDAYC